MKRLPVIFLRSSLLASADKGNQWRLADPGVKVDLVVLYLYWYCTLCSQLHASSHNEKLKKVYFLVDILKLGKAAFLLQL